MFLEDAGFIVHSLLLTTQWTSSLSPEDYSFNDCTSSRNRSVATVAFPPR